MNKGLARGREENEKRYQIYSRKRLIDNLTKKFSTTMIGALSEIEKTFGHLWGQGLNERDLTKSERDMREKYMELRTKILNNGNNQLRAAIEELNQYSTEWQRYRVDFFPASKLVDKD
jgi:hypothetical protein